MESSTTSLTKLDSRIGFIGGGQMALALAKGFMSSGLIAPSQVLTSAPSDNNLIHWRQLGASTTPDNAEVIATSDIIFLAVKPHIFPAVIAELEMKTKGEKGIEEEGEARPQSAPVGGNVHPVE